MPPTFATQWLFPRLGHFKRTLPQVTLNFVRYEHAHDFSNARDFDAAIQYGYGNWPSANARFTSRGKSSTASSAAACRDSIGLREPDDLRKATLLQHIEVPLAWHDWMLEQCDTSGSRFGPGFNQYSLIVRAAVSSLVWAWFPPASWKMSCSRDLHRALRQRFKSSPGATTLCAPTSRPISPPSSSSAPGSITAAEASTCRTKKCLGCLFCRTPHVSP